MHLPNGRGGHPRIPSKLSGLAAQGEEARARPSGDADGPARRHSRTAPGLVRVPLAGLHHGSGGEPVRGRHLLPLPEGAIYKLLNILKLIINHYQLLNNNY